MGELFFLDTNVILYSLSAGESEKQLLAERWLAALWEVKAARVSWQVVNEFYSNATRKYGVAIPVARSVTDQLVLWSPEAQTKASISRAWHWCDSAQVNYWDALIVAAAEQSGCRYLLTEDLQTGRKFGNVEVVNPFQRGPEEFQLPSAQH